MNPRRRRNRLVRSAILVAAAGLGAYGAVKMTEPAIERRIQAIDRQADEVNRTKPRDEEKLKSLAVKSVILRDAKEASKPGAPLLAAFFALRARRRHLEKKKDERKKRHTGLGKVFE